MIYLDYNATTPVEPAVAEAMRPFILEQYGNPTSVHAFGQVSRRAIEAARSEVATLIGARSEEITFTSGGTEASNMAIKGVARLRGGAGKHIVTTVVEHPATLNPIQWLEGFGFTQTVVPVDGTGLVDAEAIRKAIRPDTILISVMHAQNEVGTIEPIVEIGRIAKEAGVLFHVDAAQSLGKIPVSAPVMNADLLSIAGHKLYAPKGIGALYIRQGIQIEPLIHGASQESGRRGGTENVAMAVGLGKAAELAIAYLSDPFSRNPTGSDVGVPVAPEPRDHCYLRDVFWDKLRTAFGEQVLLNGHPTLRLPSTLSISFPGHVGGEILDKLDGVCASVGAACHAGDTKPSRVLTAMGYDKARAVGTIRLSLGRPTTESEIEQVVAMLEGIL